MPRAWIPKASETRRMEHSLDRQSAWDMLYHIQSQSSGQTAVPLHLQYLKSQAFLLVMNLTSTSGAEEESYVQRKFICVYEPNDYSSMKIMMTMCLI